jgi:hypothetical protein
MLVLYGFLFGEIVFICGWVCGFLVRAALFGVWVILVSPIHLQFAK